MKAPYFCFGVLVIALGGCAGGNSDYQPRYRQPTPEAAYKPYTPPPVRAPTYTPNPYASADYGQPESAAPPPKESKPIVSGKDFEVSEVSAKMGGIDDIGLLFVRRPDGSVVLAQSAVWKYGLAGSASGSLTKYLESGNNLIVFALYSHKAKKLPFGKFVLDKWSYSLSLFGDGTAIWNDSDKGSQVENGVVSWSAFSVVKSGDSLVISRASNNQRAMLKPAFNKINSDFLKHPVSEDITDISNAVAVGIRTEVTGSN